MAKKPDSLPQGFDADDSGGWLADEDDFDRRALWRLGSWGVASVAAVIVAVMASQSSLGQRRDQIAATDLARQSQQIASVARETQSEARRLASAIDTLNGDRDRLYSRVTVLEQGLDNVTGSIARQNSATVVAQVRIPPPGASEPPPAQTSPAIAAAPATTVAALTDKPREATARQQDTQANTAAATPATPLVPAKSMMAPPDPGATKLVVPEQPPEIITATAPPQDAATPPDSVSARPADETPAARTEFGIDLGGAPSIDGLRALWRGLLASNEPILSALRPLIVIKERNNGPGMQLRLVAGPLSDAAAAAKICAALAESQHACETSVFDGQRLAMKTDETPPVAKPAPRKRTVARRVTGDEATARPKPLVVSPVFGARQQMKSTE
jgi:hypothetical protein